MPSFGSFLVRTPSHHGARNLHVSSKNAMSVIASANAFGVERAPIKNARCTPTNNQKGSRLKSTTTRTTNFPKYESEKNSSAQTTRGFTPRLVVASTPMTSEHLFSSMAAAVPSDTEQAEITNVIRNTKESLNKTLIPTRKTQKDGQGSTGKTCEPVIDKATLLELASQKATPLSLSNMYRFASSDNQYPGQRLRNAQFLHRELPTRMAQRAMELLHLPHALNRTSHIRHAANTYLQYLQKLTETPMPKNDKEEREFTALLHSLVLDRKSIPMAIDRGLRSLKDSRREAFCSDKVREIEKALYHFFTARVGLRFITEHHIHSAEYMDVDKLRREQNYLQDEALENESYERFLGCIQKNCDPAKELRAVAKQVTRHCENSYGSAPKIEVLDCTTKENVDREFTYVPHHLHHMVAELLKNSCRAVVKKYAHCVDKEMRLGTLGYEKDCNIDDGKNLPPIRAVVVKGAEDVTIKICDHGGGVPRSAMKNIFSFAGSKLGQDETLDAEEFAKDTFTGHTRGFGIPLARIYARYFGGELTLKSMEGHGVDAYLYLPVLGKECENLSSRVYRSPGNLDSNIYDIADENHDELNRSRTWSDTIVAKREIAFQKLAKRAL